MSKFSVALCALGLLLIPFSALAEPGSLTFSYAENAEGTTMFGSNRAELYNLAIDLTNEAYEGRELTVIKVAVKPSPVYDRMVAGDDGEETIVKTPCLSGLKFWLSKKLNAETVDGQKTHVPDVATWDMEMPIAEEGGPEYAWVTLTLLEPYKIEPGGVYAGISLKVDELNEETKKPFMLFTPAKQGGLLAQSSRTYKNWDDRSESAGGVLPMYVTLYGDYPINGAIPGCAPYGYFEIGKQYDFCTTVTNTGQSAISSIGYTVEADGNEYEGEYTFPEPIPSVFGARGEATFRTPVVMTEGSIDINIHITSVNGAINEEDGRSTSTVSYVGINPEHLTLVEEFTGTWCGFCPRGFAAMQEMNRRYENFTGIAYHTRDPMTMKDGNPDLVSGYPQCSFDRNFTSDPYRADASLPGFTLPQVWEQCNAEFSPIAISVEAQWNPEDRTVSANTTLQWAAAPTDSEEANYRIEYVLVADGLSGEGRLWSQHNYFWSDEPGSMEYMEQFLGTDEYVEGLIFDDVAIMTTGNKGIPGSIDCFDYGVIFTHAHTFDTDNALNIYDELIPFSPEKLRVFAFVLKGYGYGSVLNACKCDIVCDEPGIAIDSQIDSEVESIEYYDLYGRKISNPTSGLYIQIIVYKNGTVHNRKIIV